MPGLPTISVPVLFCSFTGQEPPTEQTFSAYTHVFWRLPYKKKVGLKVLNDLDASPSEDVTFLFEGVTFSFHFKVHNSATTAFLHGHAVLAV